MIGLFDILMAMMFFVFAVMASLFSALFAKDFKKDELFEFKVVDIIMAIMCAILTFVCFAIAVGGLLYV